ncbi:MAG TPA: porin family protein [Sphingopyxis sp.]|nr:porin family protein [Sphingopyxis sp.]
MSAALAAAAFHGLPAHAQENAAGNAAQPVRVSPEQLFAIADQARSARDFATAETAWRALATNPDIELRTEARFRLAMMLADDLGKYREAAVLFREILDEKPGAARVRIELARMQAMLGDLRAAERELRSAQAAGLPPEVEQQIRFYAAALSARKPFGGSVSIAFAPDSNINRATRSDTLGTIIGDFTLDEDAKARSGLGLALRGQAYFRTGIDKRSQLLVRASTYANLYRAKQFDDIALSIQAGPEYASGKDRINISGEATWRWYGLDPYSFSAGVGATWQHPMGDKAQLRIDGRVADVNNRRNPLQDATNLLLAASYDRAFSAKFGGGLQVSGNREAARDPGYSTASGGVTVYLFRELGQTTLTASAGYSRLEADRRLFLYPRRRVDDRLQASLGGHFRFLKIGSFAPTVKVGWERNKSTVEIWDYSRISAEFGITSAF